VLSSSSGTTHSLTTQMQTNSTRASSRTTAFNGSLLSHLICISILHIFVSGFLSLHGLAFTQLVLCAFLLLVCINAASSSFYFTSRLVNILIFSIQYDKLFAHRYIVESVFIIIEILYFAVAIFFSHFVYKHFKNLSNGGGMFFNNNEAQLQEQGQGQGNYQAVRE